MNAIELRRDLERITGGRPLDPEEGLTDVLARLDAVAAEAGLPERLHHYLSKRSYAKALAWLDDPQTPHVV